MNVESFGVAGVNSFESRKVRGFEVVSDAVRTDGVEIKDHVELVAIVTNDKLRLFEGDAESFADGFSTIPLSLSPGGVIVGSADAPIQRGPAAGLGAADKQPDDKAADKGPNGQEPKLPDANKAPGDKAPGDKIGDYDLDANPVYIRHIHDEIREVSPGLFLGPAMWNRALKRSGRGSGAPDKSLVLWFALDSRLS